MHGCSGCKLQAAKAALVLKAVHQQCCGAIYRAMHRRWTQPLGKSAALRPMQPCSLNFRQLPRRDNMQQLLICHSTMRSPAASVPHLLAGHQCEAGGRQYTTQLRPSSSINHSKALLAPAAMRHSSNVNEGSQECMVGTRNHMLDIVQHHWLSPEAAEVSESALQCGFSSKASADAAAAVLERAPTQQQALPLHVLSVSRNSTVNGSYSSSKAIQLVEHVRISRSRKQRSKQGGVPEGVEQPSAVPSEPPTAVSHVINGKGAATAAIFSTKAPPAAAAAFPPRLLQQQQQAATRLLLVGIDPDSGGALAVVSADLVPAKAHTSSNSSHCNSNGSHGADKHQQQADQQQRQQLQSCVDLSRAEVSVYDMPVQAIPMKKKTKQSPQRYRRRLDVAGAVATMQHLVQQQQQILERQHQHHHHRQQQSANGNGSTHCSHNDRSNDSRPSAKAQNDSSNSQGMATGNGGHHGGVLLRAFLEVSSIVPTNGSLAILNQGYSIGAWTALLVALGFEVSTVHVKHWKKDLGLLGCDKGSSRQLAQQIFNTAGNSQDHLLARKKDHGRAEALLLAAWGCGWTLNPDSQHPHQGLLRNAVQMDGGMHNICERDSSVELMQPARAAAAGRGSRVSKKECKPIERTALATGAAAAATIYGGVVEQQGIHRPGVVGRTKSKKALVSSAALAPVGADGNSVDECA